MTVVHTKSQKHKNMYSILLGRSRGDRESTANESCSYEPADDLESVDPLICFCVNLCLIFSREGPTWKQRLPGDCGTAVLIRRGWLAFQARYDREHPVIMGIS